MPNLLSSLQHLFRRETMDHSHHITVLLNKPADTPCPYFEFRKDYALAWTRAFTLHAAYPDPPPLSQCCISTIKLMKMRSTSEHEYTLSYLTNDGLPWDTSTSKVGILRCERTVAERDHNVTGHTRGLLQSSSRGDHIRAQDRITVYDPDAPVGKDADEVYTHNFDSTACPSVSKLIAAATVLNEDSPHYLLLRRQCFWFAALSFRLLVGRPADDLQANPEMRNGMVLASTEQGLTKVRCSGSFKHVFKIVTGKEIEQDCARLTNTFQEKLDQIDAELKDVKDDWEHKGLVLQQKNEELSRAHGLIAALLARPGGSSGLAVD
ncbi:hypothetical protein L226DRAFT_392313 [Lentinus tigrinus ALCF2SS1-7]|uniref:Uncharacterized protein n=1 Tax=Lentinus tigrinus ALCF2SS1-6 TaxID=1328759 RepID=A0A5C2S9Y7_9APHY|nr:hypothetical protein L227DRAFT_94134 [Lentinus tigrinus ALCF2SS1-6]RPD75912.1 hypothetical protein L226DRAFT_392313 [Lentinus tigrinus ALCF2SS1-7]